MNKSEAVTLAELAKYCADIDDRMDGIPAFQVMICDFGEPSPFADAPGYPDFVSFTFSSLSAGVGKKVHVSANVLLELDAVPRSVVHAPGMDCTLYDLAGGWTLSVTRRHTDASPVVAE